MHDGKFLAAANTNLENILHMPRFQSMDRLTEYDLIRKIGQGTFGVVRKARRKKDGKLVALKQLVNHSAKEGFPITALREITILKQLSHENILEIVGMVYEEAPGVALDIRQRGVFYTVAPYMSLDLVGVLTNPESDISVPAVKCIMLQLLQGVNYIHQQHLLHRDIKAANILLDPNGVLKIADFGLARKYHGKLPERGRGPGGGERQYTALVVTRWYRAPELLLGERKYTTAVDMWGVGCVFGELFVRKPILVGSSDALQAQMIFDLVGPPNREAWPGALLLPNKPDLNIGLTCKRSLEQRFASLGPLGVKLLSSFLTLDPEKRYNALDAMEDAYFKEKPLPFAPKQLPQYGEIHEIDKGQFKRKRSATPETERPEKAKKESLWSRPIPKRG